jgi:cytochrome b561
MANRKITKYSSVSKWFHWFIALFIIIMLIVGFLLDDMPEQYMRTAYTLHKSIGISILFLMIIRLIWIISVGKPSLPDTVKPWEKKLSRLVQYGFYLLLFIMPLSGWILSVAAGRTPHYFGLFEAPLPFIEKSKYLAELMANSHLVIAWIIIGFLALHILGALKHHFIDKDNVLKSMLPSKKN